MKKILSIISSAIGAALVALSTFMPFDGDVDVLAPITVLAGFVLLLLPQVGYWRKKENGAIVTAAAIIGVSVVLAAIILATFAGIS